MKILKCHECGKLITEDDVGLRTKDNKVYCKSCTIKMSQKDIKEKRENDLKEIEEIRKRKNKSLNIKIFLSIAIPIIILEIIFLLLPVSSNELQERGKKQFIEKVEGPLSDLIKLSYLADEYYRLKGEFPDSITQIEDANKIINDSIIYEKNKEYGYFIYKMGDVPLEPVFTAKGIFPTFVLQGGKK